MYQAIIMPRYIKGVLGVPMLRKSLDYLQEMAVM